MQVLTSAEQTQIPNSVYDLGQQFYHNAMEQYGNILYDERAAKTAVLLGYVSCGAVMLTGLPGGGKSTLARNSHLIFEDIADSERAVVPPSMELQAIELVGGRIERTEETDDQRRVISTVLKGLVNPNSKVIWADELNRISPFAVNALLGAPEEHELKTNAGIIPLPDFRVFLSTANATESKQATVRVADATASRHSAGAIVGHDVSRPNKAKLLNGIKPNKSLITPIASTSDLKVLQSHIAGSLIPERATMYGVELVEHAVALLAGRDIDETENRLLEQVGRNAKALALFDGEKVDESYVLEGLRYAVAARLGALSTHNHLVQGLADFVGQADSLVA